MIQKTFCIRKSLFLIGGVAIFILVFVILLNKYILKQNYSTSSKAATNSLVASYNRQLVTGLLTKENAQKRLNLIGKSFIQNPQNALASGLLLSKEEVDKLKDKNATYVARMQKEGLMEEYVDDIQGTYTIHHTDTFKDVSIDTPILETQSTNKNNERDIFELHTEQKKLEYEPGTLIQLKNVILLENSAYAETIRQQAQKKTQILGEKTQNTEDLDYLVIPFYFDDNANFVAPFSKEQIKKELFDSNNPQSTYNFYKAGSWGKVNLKGTVLDWMKIPVPSTLKNITSETCAYTDWSVAADNIIKTNNKYSNYKNIKKRIYIFPYVPCEVTWHEEPILWAGRASQNGDLIWINGKVGADSYIHEIGHNLGLDHAHYHDCIGNNDNDYNNCEDVEYGDFFDVMGTYINNSHLFNIYSRNKLGWLPYGNKNIIYGKKNNLYTLYNADLKDNINQLLLLKIAIAGTNDYYTVEYRSIDNFHSYSHRYRVIIHFYNSSGTSYLHKPYISKDEASSYYLDEHKIFYDQSRKVYIKVRSRAKEFAIISILSEPSEDK